MVDAKELGDPRLRSLFNVDRTTEPDVRPVVRLPRTGPSGVVLAVIAVVMSALLFWALESRRTSPEEPAVRARAADATGYSTTPPPLYIPLSPLAPQVMPPTSPVLEPVPGIRPVAIATPVGRVAPPQVVYMPQPSADMAPPTPQAPVRTSTGPILVVDTAAAPAEPGEGAAPKSGSLGVPSGAVGWARTRASALANRSNTVPQGTIIPAVLETAFNSSRPGFARAIVSRDVRGFDGKRVLIQRGSRIIGDYRSEVRAGQNRALINWTRVIRPDGITIAIGSPTVDPLGGGGIPASVNSHFFERFTSAVLQSAVSLGGTFVTRRSSDPVVVALPGSQQSLAPAQSYEAVPTLTVPAGKSISIFVANDLDFGAADGRR
jgi:type IV secretion system protein VirB10